MTKTAEQRRADEKVVYNAFIETCPTRQMLASIAEKWTALTVSALADGPMRHGELMRKIRGASQKMLTQTLRKLERDGLLVRTVTPTVPVRVDYELTPLGQTLVPVLVAVKAWSETHIEEVMAARDAFEAAEQK
ncbi:helix-turn-helix domain-containing protein [Kutzneria buriramensis]|uniref:DNA-binding HxlR family transcriptional regulator n=1 Tax=Kutzneria buriramensis TaxID=1045776 RepID=A0A3E0I5H1_9PSEU|nr:helix-turn-helix domain-containing protein [Kutzneria buriramensis]REH54004.1 DNA-binding HxlR family transcriptional regulator [Kutzneria buriramensis]